MEDEKGDSEIDPGRKNEQISAVSREKFENFRPQIKERSGKPEKESHNNLDKKKRHRPTLGVVFCVVDIYCRIVECLSLKESIHSHSSVCFLRFFYRTNCLPFMWSEERVEGGRVNEFFTELCHFS